MATCKICSKRIGNRKPQFYVLIRRKPTSKDRKIYACENCQKQFDRWIDSRATDPDGNLLEADSPMLLALQHLNWKWGRGTVIGYNLAAGIVVRRIIHWCQLTNTIYREETRRFRFDGETVFFLGHQQRIK